MFKSTSLCAIMITVSLLSFGQTTVVLNQLETGDQEHCATLKVQFQPGYSYTPTGVESMHAYISSSCYPNGISYARVQKKVDGGYYSANDNKVYFQYDEDYFYSPFTTLNYKIYKESDLQSVVIVPTVIILEGDNRGVIDLTTMGSMSLGYYILEIENSKKEKRYLRFKSFFEYCLQVPLPCSCPGHPNPCM